MFYFKMIYSLVCEDFSTLLDLIDGKIFGRLKTDKFFVII